MKETNIGEWFSLVAFVMSTPVRFKSINPMCVRFLYQLMDINESPVYVLLNPTINHAQKDLPISIFESGEFFWTMNLCAIFQF